MTRSVRDRDQAGSIPVSPTGKGRKMDIDKDLENACIVVAGINEQMRVIMEGISSKAEGTIFGTTLHIEHVPGSYTTIMAGDEVMWDSEDENDEGDSSYEAMRTHIEKRMRELLAAVRTMNAAFRGRQRERAVLP